MSGAAPRLTRHHAAPPAGIVHLGLGAFFRAHGAQVIADAGGDWGIIGVSLRSPGIRDSLAPQDHAYTAVERGPKGDRTRVVEVLRDVVFAPDDPEGLLRTMADPAIRIVSLTVTEKGYCHIPSTGALDAAHPDIVADLQNPLPRSAIGYLVRALQHRHAAGHRPFTVMSCDNLPDNGRVVRTVVLGLARRLDPALADWIAAEARFPSTMVDRIVPATTPEDIASLSAQTGRHDAAPVFHEPFLQWAIEDSFVDDARPAFDGVPGCQLVHDVAPFEAMKLRMLNGTHSALAYLGYLAGYQTISDTVADPGFRGFVRALWTEEIMPTVTPPQDTDLAGYAQALLARFANDAIRHRTWQIAMDGSQKLPQRLLGTLADAQAAGRASPRLALAVAAWMRYAGGVDEAGQPIDVRDPLAARLRACADAGRTPRDKVANLLGMEEVFANTLNDATKADITSAYETLVTQGARAAVSALSPPEPPAKDAP